MYLGPFCCNSWSWQYLLPPGRIAKSCCGPVGLFFLTNPSLFFLSTCTRLLSSSSLFFSSSSFLISRSADAHRTSPMPSTVISVSLVNVFAIFHINQKMQWGMADSATFIPKWQFFGLLSLPNITFCNVVCMIRNGFVSNVSPFDWYGSREVWRIYS